MTFKLFFLSAFYCSIFLTNYPVDKTDRQPNITENTKTLDSSKDGQQGEKHALIIAIAKYDFSQTGWRPIAAHNDVPLIRGALLNQNFRDENIATLLNEKATKEGALEALDELIDKVGKNDIVIVHYSGHGQQIQDTNGDETDGLDEALVMIDAPVSADLIPGYKGEKHLRDEELGVKIEILRRKVGTDGQVVVIMDSCHSGTGTRGGYASTRGGEPPMYFSEQASKEMSPQEKGWGIESNNSRGSSDEMGAFVLFAGARFDELNYETKDEAGNFVGSLSYAFSKALSELHEEEPSYRTLFAHVQLIMSDLAPNQTPMLEGDIDTGVFGGEVSKQEAYYQVDSFISEYEAEINGGMIHSLTVGSRIGLYSIGTTNPKTIEPLIEGTISQVNPFTSIVAFDDIIETSNPAAYWVFVTSLNTKPMKLRVDTSNLNESLRGQVEEEIAKIKMINITSENPDIRLASPKTRGSEDLLIIGSDFEQSFPVDKVSEVLEDQFRSNLLKTIEFQDEKLLLELEMLPVIISESGDGYQELRVEEFVNGGVLEFPEGTQTLLKVNNEGVEKAYFSILGISPDGAIYPVAPNTAKGLVPEECSVNPGQELVVPNFYLEMGPPFGTEVFKVFATPEPVNLEPILNTRGQYKGRGSDNPISLLIGEAFGTRGAEGQRIVEASGSSFNFVFKIIPK